MRKLSRKIIIPKGTLNDNEVNVVVIPRTLQNTTQPLIVKPRAGKKMLGIALPIWGDELETSPMPESPIDDWTQWDQETNFEEEDFIPQVESTRICSLPPPDFPRLVHISSQTVIRSSTGPESRVEFALDAEEGIDTNILETVVEQGTIASGVNGPVFIKT